MLCGVMSCHVLHRVAYPFLLVSRVALNHQEFMPQSFSFTFFRRAFGFVIFFGHVGLRDLIGRRSLRDKEKTVKESVSLLHLYTGLGETANLRPGAGRSSCQGRPPGPGPPHENPRCGGAQGANVELEAQWSCRRAAGSS